MTAFDRDKLRDELAKHRAPIPDYDRGYVCTCGEQLNVVNLYDELAIHQADVALAWVEAQMSEERQTSFQLVQGDLFADVEQRRLVTNWKPVEGGTE